MHYETSENSLSTTVALFYWIKKTAGLTKISVVVTKAAKIVLNSSIGKNSSVDKVSARSHGSEAQN